MEELKKFCNACGEEKDVISIETDSQSEKIELSCGHRMFSVVLTESIELRESLHVKHKGPGHKRPLTEEYQREKVGGKSMREAKEKLIIDRENKVKIHQVWERDENGKWVLVHDERVPL